jgi:hypothetical protein
MKREDRNKVETSTTVRTKWEKGADSAESSLILARTDEIRSKFGSLKEIRLKPALLSARSGKKAQIVLKPTLFGHGLMKSGRNSAR